MLTFIKAFPRSLAGIMLFVSTNTCCLEVDYQDKSLPSFGKLGAVDFSVSCSDEAQKAMNTGVALLHHMMYSQAEMHFGAWIKRAEDCAMLYWGYSMSLFHPLWPDKISDEAILRGEKAITKANSLAITKREMAYITAAAAYFTKWQTLPEAKRITRWAENHEKLAELFPNDIDAVAFHALAMLVTASKKDPTYSQNQQAGRKLEKLLINSPNHPGAVHYAIHAYDNPVLAEKALSIARSYDKIAPEVPHALHMPSHIFVRLGMWQDAVSWNVRSANAALKYSSKELTSMHYAHALDYLVYSYMQINQKALARQAFEEIANQPPMPPTFPVAYALASIPARIALESHQWHEASQLPVRAPGYIDWTAFPQIEAITYFSRGVGAARINDINAAKQNLAELHRLLNETKRTSPTYWAILVEAQVKAVDAWINYAQGNGQQAIAQLVSAANLEDSVDKDPVTPGAVLPIREQLGDMYMLVRDEANAKIAYETCLNTNRNRTNSLTALRALEK